ncbi:MAG: hypothetical protein JNL52_07450 [Flavobacteriales bacterium]|nr:hypothetical protein [Flavobacteriales bacterium]
MIGRIAQWAVAVLGIIFTVMIFSGNETGIDGGLWITYIAFGLSAATAVIFSFTALSKKSLIGIGGFLGLLVAAYVLADGSVQPGWNISEGTSKWIGTGLIMLYVAMAGAVGAIIYGEITRLMK